MTIYVKTQNGQMKYFLWIGNVWYLRKRKKEKGVSVHSSRLVDQKSSMGFITVFVNGLQTISDTTDKDHNSDFSCNG